MDFHRFLKKITFSCDTCWVVNIFARYHEKKKLKNDMGHFKKQNALQDLFNKLFLHFSYQLFTFWIGSINLLQFNIKLFLG